MALEWQLIFGGVSLELGLCQHTQCLRTPQIQLELDRSCSPLPHDSTTRFERFGVWVQMPNFMFDNPAFARVSRPEIDVLYLA